MFLDKSQLVDSCKTVVQRITDLDKPSCLKLDTRPGQGGQALRLAETTKTVIESRSLAKTSSFAKRIQPNEGAVVGDLLDTFAGAANFDWSCNPAASEGQTIACEMLRKQVGLNTAYSFAHGGLELFTPHVNEALLLCYHSTTYNKPSSIGHKLVVYGVEDPLMTKPFQMRNCSYIREMPTSDTLKTVPDLSALQSQIEFDLEKGLSPHFLVFRPQTCDALSRHYAQMRNLSERYKLHFFLDLGALGIQALRPGLCKEVDAEFVLFDMAEASYLSSGVLFLKDKGSYGKNIVNPHQEYLQNPTKNASPAISSNASNASSIVVNKAEAKLDVHDFIIGFSYYVSWQKFLFYCISKGKNGIASDLACQASNCELIQLALAQLSFVKETQALDGKVAALLLCSGKELSEAFYKKYNCLPFEVSPTSNNLIYLHAPTNAMTRTEVFEFVDNIKTLLY